MADQRHVKRLFQTDDDVTVGGHQLKVEEAAAVFFRQIKERALTRLRHQSRSQNLRLFL